MDQTARFIDVGNGDLGIRSIELQGEVGWIFSDGNFDGGSVRSIVLRTNVKNLRQKGYRYLDQFVHLSCLKKIAQLEYGINFGAIGFKQPAGMLAAFGSGPAILNPSDLCWFADVQLVLTKAFRL